MLSPNSGLAGSQVSIYGSGFGSNRTITLTFDGAAVSFINGPSFNSGTKLCSSAADGTFTCTFAVPPASTGAHTVAVSDGLVSGSAGYTVTVVPPAPRSITVSSVSPAYGRPTGGNTVRIIGKNFTNSTAVLFGTAAGTVMSTNSTGTVITVKPPAGVGAVHVQVLGINGTSDNTTPESLYSYGPVVRDITPPVGPAGGGNMVTLIGHNFLGVTSVTFGNLPSITSGLVISKNGTTLKVRAPAAPAGTGGVHVVATAPNSGSLSAGSSDASGDGSYYSYGAAVTQVSPNVGPSDGGNRVTISGRGFKSATSIAIGGTTISLPAAGIIVTDRTIVIRSMPAQLDTDPGQVDIVVTGPGGSSPVVADDKYAYGPVIRAISPRFGFPSTSKRITITGRNFTGATSIKFGTTAVPLAPASAPGQPGVQANGRTIILTTVPAHAPGTVNVTVTNPDGTSPVSSKMTFDFY